MGFLLQLLANLLGVFFGLALLFRLFQVNYYNPLVQQILAFTEPVLSPIRRVLPPIWRLDLACFLILCVILALPILLQIGAWNPIVIVWALIAAGKMLTALLMYAVFLAVIISWVAPHGGHPAAEVIDQLTTPLMAPFRRIMGGLPLDISPIFVLLGISLARQFLQYQAWRFSMPDGIGL